MNDNNIDRILDLNEEFLNLYQSKEYKIGTIIYNKNKLKSLLKISNTYLKLRKYKYNIDYEIIRKTVYKGEKIAVYTVMFGSYDCINEPVIIENCDYYIITDQEVYSNSIWKKIDISEYDEYLKDMSNVEKNRFFKMNTDILNEYKYVIYIDSNIKIIAGITDLIEYINPKTGLAIHNHQSRNCLFDELSACIILNKVPKNSGLEHIKKYETSGMPHQFGLYECCVIVRDCKNKIASSIMKQWWFEFINGEIKRDQLYLPYVIWSNGYAFCDIGLLGNNIDMNPHFRRNFHL